jgi:hypothetical protein
MVHDVVQSRKAAVVVNLVINEAKAIVIAALPFLSRHAHLSAVVSLSAPPAVEVRAGTCHDTRDYTPTSR